jgi:hypothetical protein
MDVADSGAEAEEPLADVPSGSDDEIEEAGGQFREVVRPVLFNTPILRLVRIVLGATFCTLVLNPPYALLSGKAAGRIEVEAPVVQPDVSNRALMQGVELVAMEAEQDAELVAETVSAVIAPSAGAYLVRTEKKRSAKPFVDEAVLPGDATHVARADESDSAAVNLLQVADSVKLVRAEARRGLGEEVDEKTTLGVVEQSPELKAGEKTPEMIWRDATLLPHVIIAALVLVGFLVHVRSRILGLLQSIPQFLVGKVRS